MVHSIVLEPGLRTQGAGPPEQEKGGPHGSQREGAQSYDRWGPQELIPILFCSVHRERKAESRGMRLGGRKRKRRRREEAWGGGLAGEACSGGGGEATSGGGGGGGGGNTRRRRQGHKGWRRRSGRGGARASQRRGGRINTRMGCAWLRGGRRAGWGGRRRPVAAWRQWLGAAAAARLDGREGARRRRMESSHRGASRDAVGRGGGSPARWCGGEAVRPRELRGGDSSARAYQ